MLRPCPVATVGSRYHLDQAPRRRAQPRSGFEPVSGSNTCGNRVPTASARHVLAAHPPVLDAAAG
jgi:hypothetical protein